MSDIVLTPARVGITDPPISALAVFDGTNWRLLKSDSSGNLLSVSGGAAADDAVASGNPVPVGGIYNTTLPTYTNLDRTQLQTDVGGRVLVVGTGNIAHAAVDSGNPLKIGARVDNTKPLLTVTHRADLTVGTRGSLQAEIFGVDSIVGVSAGASTADAITASNTNGLFTKTFSHLFNGTTWDREVKATTVARLLSAAASTNGTSVKASAGNVFKIVGAQANVAARYLKLYNKASGPTVGTDTPVATFYLPPSTINGGIFEFDFGAQPLFFATGIAYALTTAAADADTGALTAADVIAMNIFYT